MIKSSFIALILITAVRIPVLAEPVTIDRIGLLPAGDQPAWKAYLERSVAVARANDAALQAEVAANNLSAPMGAPEGGNFKLSANAGDPWFTTDEAGTLADIVLSYQTPAGGWSKHTGYSHGPRKPGMQWSSQSEPGGKPHYLGTFDNRSTTDQLTFLAGMWQATKREDCRAGFIKGLGYILAAQYPNGGWPQVYPLEGGYHDDITFNDDAMTHILELLQAIASDVPCYSFIDEPMRRKAADALEKGIGCVIKTQIVRNGKKTAWCAQCDPLTLDSARARKMEPVSLSGMESANIIEFLMSIPNPTPELVATIESGLEWLERVKIKGLAMGSSEGRTVYEPDPSSTEVYWARFYSLTDDKPVFPGRDGILYGSFAEMAAKNKLGYDYYTTRPASVVKNGQKKWRKMRSSKQME